MCNGISGSVYAHILHVDEISIIVAVYFSMQNIYQSCDLVRAVRRSNADVS